MSNQLVITSGAKVRNLEGVLTGTSGVVNSVPLGAANGVATLDSGGKVPVSQLPSSVVTYLGTWDAATNTPTLTNGVGDAGDMYICNVAGTVNFGAGPITFAVGDWVLYGSGTWQKSNGQNGTVTSVGASITGNSIGITGSPIVSAGTLAFAFAGTAAQYINGAGNLVTFPSVITEAQRLITEVYNETGATLTKGTVVYINGGHGNLPTVTKAIATGDSTSAQTYGVVQNDITDNNNGYVVVLGSLGDLDTQAYPNGTQLYLSSTTAGAWTSTKQYAPAHLVYVGIVVRSHPTQGVVEVRIQNGFELDELHNVSAQTPSNNQGLFYNSSNQLWENKSIATALGYTPANDASVVHLAGTETITGIKTFSNGLNTDYIGITGDMTMDGSFLLKHVAYGTLQSGYTNLSGQTNGLRVGLFGGYNALLNFSTSGSYNYTFPAITGTLAMLEGTQTFSGSKTFNSSTLFDMATLFKKVGSPYLTSAGYTSLQFTASGTNTSLYITDGDSVTSNRLIFKNNSGYDYTFPAASGTVALLEFSQTFSGLQSFTNTAGTDLTYGAYLTKNSIPSFSSSLTVNLYSASGNNNLVIRDNGNTSKLQFQATSSYTYTFPASNGTVALTSDLSAYVTLGTYQTITANKTFSGWIQANTLFLSNTASISSATGFGTLTYNKSGIVSTLRITNENNATASLIFDNTTNYNYTFPASTGTLALTSDLTNYVNLTTAQTIGGTKTFSDAPKMDGSLFLKIGATSSTTGYMNLGGRLNGIRFTSDGGTSNDFNLPSLTGYSFTFPNASGTVALTSDIPSLTGYVQGTGTTNYLPKFTGTSTIGNSAFYEASGNLLIGSTTAGWAGTTGIELNGAETVLAFRKSGANAGYVYHNGTNLYISNELTGASAGSLIFNNNAGTRMTLTSTGVLTLPTSGSVEVGYSSVQGLYKLDVNGTGRFSGALTGTSATFGDIVTNTSGGYRTSVQQGYILRNDANSANLGGFTRRSYWAGGAALDTQIFAETGYGIYINVNGSSTTGLSIASTGAATFTGDVTLGGSAVIFGTTGSKFYVYPAFSTNLNLLQNYNGSAYTTEEHRASDYSFKIGTTAALTIASTGAATFSGNVGINQTASGTTALVVKQTLSGEWIAGFTNTGTNPYGIYIDTSTNSSIQSSFQIYTNTGGGVKINNNGNVLIGTTTDSGQKLQVNGTILAGGSIKIPSTSYFIGNATYGYRFNNEADTATLMTIFNGGYIGIGNSGSSTIKFYLTSIGTTSSTYAMRLEDSSTNALLLVRDDGYGYLKASAWAYGSDKRIKENINYIETGIDKVMALKPATFDYINGVKNNIGWIAQDVQQVIPEAVNVISKDNDQLTLKSDFIVPYLVKAIQEQQAQIQELKQLINK